MLQSSWLIPLFPLLSFILLLILRKSKSESTAWIGVLLTGISLVLSVGVWLAVWQGDFIKVEGTWFQIGERAITMGYEVNPLNALMLVIVSLVSFLVHLYSKGYMHGDERFPVFFAYLGLFSFAMLGLVLSPNLLQLYMFWELVGLGSFLLIGFYYFKPEAKAAAKKAFVMTRIGDVGLFIGMVLLFWQVGSFEYDEIFASVKNGDISSGMLTLTALCIFVGAIGKSGQLPLHTWLPDAMEGPTPVSALIHAATMVAAGVYLVAAMYPLFQASETALTVVAVVGGVTAIFAASIGLMQKDIKRVLAYSTVSQLGYMMLALGASGYVAGIFHLTTHAFFKALLFLAAGSVIHAVHTQNIEEMGGLWKKLRVTGPLFLIGALAISGVPLLSGFFSKDEILASTYADGKYGLFWLAVVAAFMTAFYMFRLFFLVFTGKPRGDQSGVHESPGVMTLPMIVLGVLAVVAGYLNTTWFGTFLSDYLARGPVELPHAEHHGPGWIPIVATAASLLGIALAYLIYRRGALSRDWMTRSLPGLSDVIYNKWYVDEGYDATFVKGTKGLSKLGILFDKYVVDGLVAAVVSGVQGLSKIGSRLQNGQVQSYGTFAIFGIVILLLIVALTGGYFS
ncbi:NADH:ubiquinone oxidoreductase subunit L [Fictibacillus phosphorivorans]|uniref:NADH:ubiquinone oxidoreductase subunit L n=1 Tax=Fictibacillus phosphorivorans TaxID=1221500 RepID=A0A168CSE1_9BACL|nr:NADH-quinone oxidoreductase subunit L [Fictibacillus phosphorivorans]KZE63938.1 NADH:ubiquinone oxidoreductase subunit L [Fictibacillus phosphorivorans]